MEPKTTSLWAKVTTSLPVSRERVWAGITEPEHTEKYMYNCQLHSNWAIGDKAVWKALKADGTWEEHVVGEVVNYTPYEHFAIKIFHKATADKPQEESFLHFNLVSRENSTELTIKQGDFSSIPSGEKSYHSCQQGWEYILPKLIETCS